MGASDMAYGQCSHLDSVLAVRLGTAFSQEAAGRPFTLAADTGLSSLLSAVPHASSGSLMVVTTFSAIIPSKDTKDLMDSNIARIAVECHGTVVGQGNNVARRWAVMQVFPVSVTPADLALLETNRDRYVTLEQPQTASIWASTIEPALALLGAGVIIALFFLIRS